MDRDLRPLGDARQDGGLAEAPIEYVHWHLDVHHVAKAQGQRELVGALHRNAELADDALLLKREQRMPNRAAASLQVTRAVQQKNVETLPAQSAPRCLDARANGMRGFGLVGAFGKPIERGKLGRDANIGYFAQRLAEPALALSIGARGVEVADACRERSLDDGEGLALARHAVAVRRAISHAELSRAQNERRRVGALHSRKISREALRRR